MNDRYQLSVENIERVTSEIKTFTFSSKKIILPQFGAGAHLILHLPIGDRQYSLINNPVEMKGEYEIAVKNVGSENGGSRYLHEQIEIGDTVEVSGPDNYFPVHLEAKHHVFFAAGIGITPFLSMMSYLTMLGNSFELHYAASNEESCAFYNEITENYAKQTSFYFLPRKEKVKKLKEALMNRKIGTHVYMCGPRLFMETLVDTTKELQYPQSVVHEERFRPATMIENPDPFRVIVNGRGPLIVEENESLLQALLNEGYSISYACRMGICGSCEVRICNGKVLHSDSFLTGEEKKDKLLSCVSRGVGEIAIVVDD